MSTNLTSYATAAFDRGTDPILGIFLPEQVRQLADYRGDGELQTRIESLATRHTEGQLSAEELAEYEGYVRANQFIAILQAKARKRLQAAD